MGEKRGNTGKLKYDFNTAWVCEVEMQGKWYRVIERDFRSYNGPRRLTRPNPPILGNVHVGNETFDYEGPYYYWNSNTEFNPEEHEKGKIIQQIGKERQKAEKTAVAGL
jgi:hypothetical protein